MGRIILRLDRVMADRKMSLNELSERVGVANVNLSKLKNGRISAIRFSTLEAICEVLDCQPGDILEYQKDEEGSRNLSQRDADHVRIQQSAVDLQLAEREEPAFRG